MDVGHLRLHAGAGLCRGTGNQPDRPRAGRWLIFFPSGQPPPALLSGRQPEVTMSKSPKPQRRSFRYWLQQLHLWIGLILLLPLVMMGITGAVLVYAHDIEHLLGQGEPAAKTVGEWRSPSELIEAAKAATKDPGRIPIAVRWPIEIGEPAAVRLSRPGMANERGQFRGGAQQQGGQQ